MMSNTYQYDSRILINNLAATLVTGQGVDSIQYCDRVADRHVDNSPIAFQTNDEHNEAQIWSFIPHNTPSTPPLQNNRAYKIVNSQTGTVLDVAGTVRKPGMHTLSIHLQPLTSCRLSLVLGLVSEGGDNHKV